MCSDTSSNSRRACRALSLVGGAFGERFAGIVEFVEDLRRLQDGGAEIFLQGLRHDEVGLHRTLGQELIAAGRAAREGEFLSLTPIEAARRIDEGLALFRVQRARSC